MFLRDESIIGYLVDSLLEPDSARQLSSRATHNSTGAGIHRSRSDSRGRFRRWRMPAERAAETISINGGGEPGGENIRSGARKMTDEKSGMTDQCRSADRNVDRNVCATTFVRHSSFGCACGD